MNSLPDERVWGMRTGIVVEVTAAEPGSPRIRSADRNSPQKHVWRAGIVLATADGLGTMASMQEQDRCLALARRALIACYATRPGPGGSSRSARKWLIGLSL